MVATFGYSYFGIWVRVTAGAGEGHVTVEGSWYLDPRKGYPSPNRPFVRNGKR